MRWVRLLWPIPAMVLAIVTVQVIWAGRRAPAVGHAAGHLSSATAVFGIAFLLGVVVWGVGARERRQPVLWLLVALVFGGAFVIMVGNVWVIDAIGGDDWSYEQADLLGPARPGFTEGHDLAGRAAWFSVGAATALAVWLGLRKALNPYACAAAAVLCVLIPGFIFPGAGLVVLAVAAVARRVHDERSNADRSGAGAH